MTNRTKEWNIIQKQTREFFTRDIRILYEICKELGATETFISKRLKKSRQALKKQITK